MCTVTYIPQSKGIILASNRDEMISRSMAKMPESYLIHGHNIVFPKDGEAGGTWIAVHENGHVMVLLNGAFEPYTIAPSYRKSRGLIFLDIFGSKMPSQEFQQIDLTDIAPFTLVLLEDGKLLELRWDGNSKFKAEADPSLPHIWSSAMLYTPEVRTEREVWFKQWRKDRDLNKVTINDIISFHTFGGKKEDDENSLVMHRGNFLRTISITAIGLKKAEVDMHYKDLISETDSMITLSLSNDHH